MGSMGIAFPFKPCSPLCDWFDRRRFPTQIDQTCGGTNAVCDPGPPQGKKPSAGEKALRRRNGGPGGSAGRELLLAAAAIRCKHAAAWFHDRAQLAEEVAREERNVYDDECDAESEAAGTDADDMSYYEAMAVEHDVE